MRSLQLFTIMVQKQRDSVLRRAKRANGRSLCPGCPAYDANRYCLPIYQDICWHSFIKGYLKAAKDEPKHKKNNGKD